MLCDTKVAIIDPASGAITQTILLYDNKLSDLSHSIAISPVGDQLLIGSSLMSNKLSIDEGTWEKFENSIVPVQILRVSDGKPLASFDKHADTGKNPVWDPKGRYVAFGKGNICFIWQPTTGGFAKVTFPENHGDLPLAVTSDGNTLAVGHGDAIAIFNIK